MDTDTLGRLVEDLEAINLKEVYWCKDCGRPNEVRESGVSIPHWIQLLKDQWMAQLTEEAKRELTQMHNATTERKESAHE